MAVSAPGLGVAAGSQRDDEWDGDDQDAPERRRVDTFLASVPEPCRRTDARALRALLDQTTGATATMWGPSAARSPDGPAVAFTDVTWKRPRAHSRDIDVVMAGTTARYRQAR